MLLRRRNLWNALFRSTCPHLWSWDIGRRVSDMGFNPNEMGDWYRHRYQLMAVRELNKRPHRKRDIRSLVPFFVFAADQQIKDLYVSAIRSFPENLPISFEEEKVHESHLEGLREQMVLFSEQADPIHWKSAPTPDGQYTQFWNDPPSLRQDRYQAQQQRHAEYSEFLSVAMWGRRPLSLTALKNALALTKQSLRSGNGMDQMQSKTGNRRVQLSVPRLSRPST